VAIRTIQWSGTESDNRKRGRVVVVAVRARWDSFFESSVVCSIISFGIHFDTQSSVLQLCLSEYSYAFLWANIETLSGSNYVYSLYQDSAHLFFCSSSFLFEKIQSENSRINWFLISTRLWKYFNKEDNLLWAGQWPPDSLIYHCNLPSKRTICLALKPQEHIS
jgi:hypothetical protein